MTLQEIITTIEEYTGTQSATTSSYPLASKVRDINLALDKYNFLAEKSAGQWQSSDDTNHLDYPIMYKDIVSGVQDYTFTVDEQGNQILNIYKVRVKDSSGNWRTLTQVDFETQKNEIDLVTTGAVDAYNLTANGIFLVNIPNYSADNAIEVWYSRTNSYFTVGDLTKVAGIPNIFHIYLALQPAYTWLMRNDPQKASLYKQDYKEMEETIKEFQANRNGAVPKRLRPNIENNR